MVGVYSLDALGASRHAHLQRTGGPTPADACTSPIGYCPVQGGGLCRLWFYKELRDEAPQFHGPVNVEPNLVC